MKDTPDIRILMSAWGYSPEMLGRVQPVLDVYRVETSDGPKNLKWTRHQDRKLLFIVSALRYLWDNGFREFAPPLLTSLGRPYLTYLGENYLLSDWIEGRQIDIDQPEELAGACRTLARFHRTSTGFHPPAGFDDRRLWGRQLAYFADHYRELALLLSRTKTPRPLTPFTRVIKEEIGYYADLAGQAYRLLSRSEYNELTAATTTVGGLCHGDVAARNFILAEDGRVCLIDFDSVRQDLRVMDLWKLIRRAMKTFAWDYAAGLQILNAYESVWPLSTQELEILLALCTFPQKFWRLINRYYSGHYEINEDRFHRKIGKYVAHRQSHAAFLRDFGAYCRERGVAAEAVPEIIPARGSA